MEIMLALVLFAIIALVMSTNLNFQFKKIYIDKEGKEDVLREENTKKSYTLFEYFISSIPEVKQTILKKLSNIYDSLNRFFNTKFSKILRNWVVVIGLVILIIFIPVLIGYITSELGLNKWTALTPDFGSFWMIGVLYLCLLVLVGCIPAMLYYAVAVSIDD